MTNTQSTRQDRFSDITLCVCCMLSVANGECCETHAETPAPYLLADDPTVENVSLGILFSEHTCGRDAATVEEDFRNGTGPDDCGCEREDFSSRPCGMCGDTLAGERYFGKVWHRA